MKNLIAVKSCAGATEFGANKLIYDTWGHVIRDADVRFFCGTPAWAFHQDEIVLDCPDDYAGLPQKTKAILNWALRKEYDFIFVCDTDTCVNPERLFTSGFSGYDLMGRLDERPAESKDVIDGATFWPSGGAGYWVSARAATDIVNSEIEDEAEDRMVGRALFPKFHNADLMTFHNNPYYGPDPHMPEYASAITRHYSPRTRRVEYDPTWMAKQYAEMTRYSGDTK